MFTPYKNYRLFRRYKQIIMTLGRYGFGELIGRLRLFRLLKLKPVSVDAHRNADTARARRFRLMLEQLGPTFIKLGQILSTRADLLPSDIVAELSSLQDRVAPMPWDVLQKKLGREFQDYCKSTFAEFDTEPIASASIAQVYKARLKTGQKVAVKIIRPGTDAIFKDDLLILAHMANLIHTHIEEARHWDVHAILDQLRTSINHELDMWHEGRNADIFRGNFAHDQRVYVPRIYWEHTKRNILVMEFIQGKPLAEFFAASVNEQARKELACNGADIVLQQIFKDGFFQADPHPGNAFVMDGNIICILDFGMFARLSRDSLDILGRVLQAVVKKDIERIFKAARDLGVLPPRDDYAELKIAVLDLIEQYMGIPLKQINIRQLLSDITRLISSYHIGIRHDFLFLFKALGTVEATGLKLDPDFDMIEHVKPFVHSLVTDRLSPRHVLDETQRFSEDFLQLTRESPQHLLEILRNVRQGHFKLEFYHKGLEEAFEQWHQFSDKMVLGMIIAALIISSALLAHAKIGPALWGFPVLGGVGFLIAGVAGLWVIMHILRNRRR